MNTAAPRGFWLSAWAVVLVGLVVYVLIGFPVFLLIGVWMLGYGMGQQDARSSVARGSV